MRTIVQGDRVAEEFARLRLDYRRFDEAFSATEDALVKTPETFPLVPGTELRRLKLVPFEGVPNLSLFFRFNDNEVVLEIAAVIEDEE